MDRYTHTHTCGFTRCAVHRDGNLPFGLREDRNGKDVVNPTLTLTPVLCCCVLQDFADLKSARTLHVRESS